jgi:triphosphoribosyl-dephospho-CoA synthase
MSSACALKEDNLVSECEPALLARLAVKALVEEVELTPKPGLVDQRGSGAHHDLTLDLMLRSAWSLEPWMAEMAEAARKLNGLALRERLGALGRQAEMEMLTITGGVNTHRGAIWTLGLLVAGSTQSGSSMPRQVCRVAGDLARLPDRFAPVTKSHGQIAQQQYGVTGARGEACTGFPHVLEFGLPALQAGRAMALPESSARLRALLTLMERLPDTCLLHRGGIAALTVAQEGAGKCLSLRGAAQMQALSELDANLIRLWASPGGSADLLAATLFLDARADAGSRGHDD